jgi:hypothetical protein
MFLKLLGNVIVLRPFQGLAVNCVGDNGLILAREIFVEQINHAVAADFGFVLHTNESLFEDAPRLQLNKPRPSILACRSNVFTSRCENYS